MTDQSVDDGRVSIPNERDNGGFDWSHQTAELIAMLPEIQSRGVATTAEVDIETLGQRMQGEIEAG
ncbi:hypothetical protein [Mesorhizobium sp. M1409]|uniref:hypothetical protein n=1 Tax=unclassified Mesorhizobium TaxID=325217 RepID=UPI00333A1E1A